MELPGVGGVEMVNTPGKAQWRKPAEEFLALLAPDDLLAQFTARRPMLETLLGIVRGNKVGQPPQHCLLIGARETFLRLVDQSHRRALLLIDNLNDVLSSISDPEPLHRLRAFLMQDSRVTVIGGATRHFDETTSIDQFSDIHYLMRHGRAGLRPDRIVPKAGVWFRPAHVPRGLRRSRRRLAGRAARAFGVVPHPFQSR